MADSSTLARPRAWRLQFSLRLLLLAFTGFAIGFPIWYRWPYDEVTQESPPGSPNPTQRITTWQRQFGGGRLKHGLERLVGRGETFESQMYRHGLKHGPYESKYDRGQFVDDMKEGVWTAPDRTMTWHRGKLNGPCEIRLPPEHPLPPKFSSKRPASNEIRKFQLVFADGRLTHFNGKPAAGRLFDLLEDDEVDPRIRMELSKRTDIDFVEMPLKDAALYLSNRHNSIPIVLDPKVTADMPITCEYRGIDLCSALTLLTAPHDVGCDYRYGCLWITTAEDTNDWHDRTGVSEIKPPSESMLARVWNESTVLNVVEIPLTDVVAYLEERLAIKIDTSQVKPNPPRPFTGALPNSSPPIATARGMPFRHLLGQVLYLTGCRCRLDGETLVILPPDE